MNNHSWKELVAVSGGLTGGMMGGFILPIQTGAFMGKLGLDGAQAGVLGTVELIACAVVMMVVSAVIGRVTSLMKLAIGGALIAVAAQLMTGFTSSYEIIWVLRPLVGGGAGIVFASALATTPTFEEPERIIGRGMAIACGFFAALLYGLPLIDAWAGYKGIFVTLSVIWVVISLLLSQLPSSQTNTESQDDTRPRVKQNRPHLFLFFSGIILLALSQSSLWSFSERIGVQLNLSGSQIGITLGLSSVAMILGALTADFMGSRIGYFIPLVCGSLLNGAFCLGTAMAETFWIYLMAIVLYGFVFYVIYPYMVGYGAGLDDSGAMASMAGSVYAMAYALGPMLGGIVMTRHSPKEVGIMCLVLSVLAMGAYALMLKLKLTRRAKTAAAVSK